VEPVPTAVTTPVELTFATAVLAAAQMLVGEVIGSPRWSLTAAVNCRVSPIETNEREGESSWTVVGTGGSVPPHPERPRIAEPAVKKAVRRGWRIKVGRLSLVWEKVGG
jgi:hypothetical protein